MGKNIAIYPGSFDPCTNGHLDVISRSSKLFDKLYVAVLVNRNKVPTFTIEERVELLKRVTSDIPNIEIISFNSLLVNIATEVGASVIIKGLRAVSDFEYEFQMALANSRLVPGIETLFLPTSNENLFLSSSLVKEVASNGGDISSLVPPEIREDIVRKFLGE